MTPLHLASSKTNVKVVQQLLKHEADVNACDQDLTTPLHVASFKWNDEVVRLLIEHGADVNACSQCHKTPLHLMMCPVSEKSAR